jgi:hypothetical protein
MRENLTDLSTALVIVSRLEEFIKAEDSFYVFSGRMA